MQLSTDIKLPIETSLIAVRALVEHEIKLAGRDVHPFQVETRVLQKIIDIQAAQIGAGFVQNSGIFEQLTLPQRFKARVELGKKIGLLGRLHHLENLSFSISGELLTITFVRQDEPGKADMIPDFWRIVIDRHGKVTKANE